MEILRDQPGFLGTGASLTADLTLLGYVLLLSPAAADTLAPAATAEMEAGPAATPEADDKAPGK